MPIYEYECRKCKAHVEVLQKMGDKPLVKCRKCGGRLEKQWSSTSFQLKGSGWYVTDYAGKKSDAGEEKKSAETAAAETAPTGDKTNLKEKPATKKTGAAKTASSSNKTSGD
ncbi:MAG: zinc ribbon domain-containing protein [Pyrinomonadaceae bacterium]